MGERVRKARPADVQGMVRLLGQLFSIEEDFDFAPDLHSRALNRILENPQSLALVAEGTEGDDLFITGMCTVQTVVSTATGELSGWVEDVVVDPAYQNRGVATALLTEAERWAGENGVNRLQLLADRDNVRALDFYTRRGWTGSHMIHRKKML